MTRINRIKSAIWNTLQNEVRKNNYRAILSKLNDVSNDLNSREEIEILNASDGEVIENILSAINETIENSILNH